MRKIEMEMNQAIAQHRYWWKDNTRVDPVQSTGGCDVYLHGHHIASVQRDGLVLVMVQTLKNWPTRTTMSRLRALGCNVYQSKNVVYLNDKAVSYAY